jgi:hypothetical protein
MATMSAALPRTQWSAFLVSPQTLLSLAPGARAKEVDLPAALLGRQATDR